MVVSMRTRWLGVIVLAIAGCDSHSPPSSPKAERAHPGLSNVLQVTEKLISGSAPEGDEGFQSLVDLGVKTIISVDGATPEVERAKRFGLRYVHLPIGYDGVPREQGLRIARAVRDLPGLVYIHCHHGKHRGPASAAVARLCLDGTCQAEDAIAYLHQAGTDPNYQGLYADVEQFRRPSAAEINAASNEFPEATQIGALAQIMVELDGRFEHLKLIRASGWKVPPRHADLDPPHEALQMRELFTEAMRTKDSEKRQPEFRQLLAQAEAAAVNLEQALRKEKLAESSFQRFASTCAECHRQFRDSRPRP
jgi:protein tyrosine phosphatase (PTP) superfamily phosphohydrolase (DUF442 family)